MKPVILSGIKRTLMSLVLFVGMFIQPGSCAAKDVQESLENNDLSRLQLKGSVSSMTEFTSVMEAKRDGKFRKVQTYKHTHDFNKAGNVTHEYDFDLLDGAWTRTVYSYDKAGNVILIKLYSRDNTLIEGTAFEYDKQGRVTVETKKSNVIMSLNARNWKVIYAYNDLGDSIETLRKEDDGWVSSRSVSNKGVLAETVEYKYNRDDSLTVKCHFWFYPSGKVKEAIYYAADGKPSRRETYVYFDSGKLKEKQSFETLQKQNPELITTRYTYDEKNNLLMKAEYRVDNSVKMWTYKYVYDQHGNWTSQTEVFQDEIIAKYKRTISYY